MKKFYIFKNSYDDNSFPLLFCLALLQHCIRYSSAQMPGEFISLADLAAGDFDTN